jgi:hypothetical protein
VRREQRFERLRAQQGQVAVHHQQGVIRPGGESFPRHLHGMPGPQRRLLPDERETAPGKSGFHRLRLVPDHHRHRAGAGPGDGAEDMLEHRHAQRRVKDLGPRALHARALSGGENQGLEGGRSHLSILARPGGPTVRRLADTGWP